MIAFVSAFLIFSSQKSLINFLFVVCNFSWILMLPVNTKLCMAYVSAATCEGSVPE